MTRPAILALALALAATGGAMADGHSHSESRGFYLGAGAARVEMAHRCDNKSAVSWSEDSAAVSSCDDAETAYKVFGGWRATDLFGLEAGYIRANEFASRGATTTGGNNPVTTPFTAKDRVELIYAGAAWFYPLAGGWSAVGRFGAQRWKWKTAAQSGGARAARKDDDIGWLLGAGAQYDFTGAFSARVEFDYAKMKGDVVDDELQMLSAGVVWRLPRGGFWR